jgi:hypothetical protein
MANVYRAATLMSTTPLSDQAMHVMGIWRPYLESPKLDGNQVVVKRNQFTAAIHHSQSMLIYTRDIRFYIPAGSIQNI